MIAYLEYFCDRICLCVIEEQLGNSPCKIQGNPKKICREHLRNLTGVPRESPGDARGKAYGMS